MSKKITLAIVSVLLCVCSFGQSGNNKQKKPEDMIRLYWFVLLTKGNSRDQDSVTAAKIQTGHLANIQKLYEEGKIKVAGPFGEMGDPITTGWLGLFIFDCATKEEVEKLLQTDPAIALGRLAYQIRPWYTAPIGSFVPGKPKTSLF